MLKSTAKILGVLLAIAPQPLLAQQSYSEPQEFRCGEIVHDFYGRVTMVADDHLAVLDQTYGGGDFKIADTTRDGSKVLGVFCVRSHIVPAHNDYKVIQAGYPFSIYENGTDRMGMIERVGGQLQFRLVKGKQFTPAMEEAVRQFLDSAQSTLDRAAARAKPAG
jgi:hypothetical protein